MNMVLFEKQYNMNWKESIEKYLLLTFFCSPISQWVKNCRASNAGDTGDVRSIPGLGRSPGGGNDNPLQYSYLGNAPVGCKSRGLQSQTWLSH